MKFNILIAAFALLLGGCVTGTRNVDLVMDSFSNEKTASGEVYIVDISDNRSFEQKPREPSTPSTKGNLEAMSKDQLSNLIGRQRNGYGKAMGMVALPESGTVQSEMRKLIVEGLESRGYTVSENPSASIQLKIDISEFWAWYTPGMFAVKFEAKIGSELNFSGSIDQSVAISARSMNKAQIASDANWRLAYKRAFGIFLDDLDKKLDEAGL
ncbi:YajG family lipoprotein [Hirschia maritima]|uniref:hypothetical protein n=1 Tax=Hirschia maritima TaxID=1121961 RepID=UPI000377EFBF|nr:hypothetical protein [Hirschia maritima]